MILFEFVRSRGACARASASRIGRARTPPPAMMNLLGKIPVRLARAVVTLLPLTLATPSEAKGFAQSTLFPPISHSQNGLDQGYLKESFASASFPRERDSRSTQGRKTVPPKRFQILSVPTLPQLWMGKMQIEELPQQDAAFAASALLARSSIADLRQLRVDERENQIQLTGRVRSFYHKQLAQESVRSVAAGKQVVNRVDVCR